MLSGSTRPPATAALPPAVPLVRAARGRVDTVSMLRGAERGDLLPGSGRTRARSVVVDPCSDVAPADRGASAATREALRSGSATGWCPVVPTSPVVRADDGPRSGRMTDAEEEAVDGVLSQAARLATVLTWVLALVALAAIVLLVRWVG